MAELRPIIVFHGRHFVHNLGICTPICVKLLQFMFGVIPRNLKKNDFSISNRFPGVHKRVIHTHTHTHTHTQTDTHTHTHDDSIRRNAMRCISPKNVSATLICFIVVLSMFAIIIEMLLMEVTWSSQH